ncbi:unnamed protein product [Moneuplotes crassus]|uniref:threonine--tRNA ligase n=1 Tax=Euplotes crassus TaxID=5936 RepID=A0AAD1X4Y4_EUPCR|nr:unnamed protein product [Moneuplotes crassus]
MEVHNQDNNQASEGKKPKHLKNKPLKSQEDFIDFKIFKILKSEDSCPKLVEGAMAQDHGEKLSAAGISLEDNPQLLFEQNIFSHEVSIEAFDEERKEQVSDCDKLIISQRDAIKLFSRDQNYLKIIEEQVHEEGYLSCFLLENQILLAKPVKGNISHSSYGLKIFQGSSESGQEDYALLMPLSIRRDHRVLGKKQELYFQHRLSPGSWFFSKEGCIVYNSLMNMIREQYKLRGFDEVMSPNLFNLEIFKISGHYQNYKEHMFMLKADGHGMGLKPMNCPGHHLIFKSKLRSYRDLPMRLAEFGVLHRNELSGALSGLSRCRKFICDDSHIYCREEQVEDEILQNLNFVDYVYKLFGLEFKLFFSSKPEKYLGDDEVWEEAENKIKQALNNSGLPWEENPGDGAFYGPKIDIVLYDSLQRAHQCASIQLDLQAPIRFNLMYKSESQSMSEEPSSNEKREGKYYDFEPDEYDPSSFRWEEQPLKSGFKRPVIIHRAVLGSVERFISILIEHLDGKWPFWISPRQAKVVPISEKFNEYAERVQKALKMNGFHSEIDSSNAKLPKKIKNAQLDQWNYMLIIGQKEVDAESVNVRARDGSRLGEMKVDDLLEKFEEERSIFPKFKFSSD